MPFEEVFRELIREAVVAGGLLFSSVGQFIVSVPHGLDLKVVCDP